MNKVCAVRDRAVDSFGQPIFVQALGLAIRSFGDELNRPDSQMGAHPGDYDLYHLADFNPDTGQFLTLDQPRMIAVGKDLKSPVPDRQGTRA